MLFTGAIAKKLQAAKARQTEQTAEDSSVPHKYGGVLWYFSELVRLGLDIEADAQRWRKRPLEKQDNSVNVYKE